MSSRSQLSLLIFNNAYLLLPFQGAPGSRGYPGKDGKTGEKVRASG